MLTRFTVILCASVFFMNINPAVGQTNAAPATQPAIVVAPAAINVDDLATCLGIRIWKLKFGAAAAGKSIAVGLQLTEQGKSRSLTTDLVLPPGLKSSQVTVAIVPNTGEISTSDKWRVSIQADRFGLQQEIENPLKGMGTGWWPLNPGNSTESEIPLMGGFAGPRISGPDQADRLITLIIRSE